VPFLLWSSQFNRADTQREFGERACALGSLGTIPATDTMSLALAHAGRLQKFGA
jgi:2,3-bisphosphoglycerate-independent phosphoglycerate mutase